MNLQSVPIKNPGAAQNVAQRTIEIEHTPVNRGSKHRTEVERDSYLEHRHSSRAKTHQVLTNVIGAHQIGSMLFHSGCANDSVPDYPFEIQHLNTGNFHLVDLQWQGAFQLTQSPLENRYLIYMICSGYLTQQIDSPRGGSPATPQERLLVLTRTERSLSSEVELCQQHQTFCCSLDTATIISPGQKLASISSQEGKVLLVSIDRDLIDLAVGKLFARPLKQPLIFRSNIDLTCHLGLILKKFLQFLWESAAGAGAVSASFVLKELEQAFLACAIKGLPSNYSEELLYQLEGACAAHVRKARAFIESNLHEDIKLEDIATAVGVCARLLQKAFSHQCGCSPMRFVTQARLQRIRQELDRSTIDTKIVDVMMNYGFTQGGKFAKGLPNN